jgi:hypothetical protein
MYGQKFYPAEQIEAALKEGKKIRKYRKKAVKK